MTRASELRIEGTGKVEQLGGEILRYIYRDSRYAEFGVLVPVESLQLIKREKRLMQDAQLWRVTTILSKAYLNQD